jgi:hypothetical protein
MMSSDSIAISIRSNTATDANEVKQQSKETPPHQGGYVTPPPSVLISKHHSSTTLGSFRFKRHHNNSYGSAFYHPAVRSSSTGRRVLLNVDSFETGASFPTTLDSRNIPNNEFILATPNQVILEIQHPAMKRSAVSVLRSRFATADSWVNSDDEILSENSRHVSLSGMFLPVHEDALKGDITVVPGRYGLRLKPKKLTERYRLFK